MESTCWGKWPSPASVCLIHPTWMLPVPFLPNSLFANFLPSCLQEAQSKSLFLCCWSPSSLTLKPPTGQTSLAPLSGMGLGSRREDLELIWSYGGHTLQPSQGFTNGLGGPRPVHSQCDWKHVSWVEVLSSLQPGLGLFLCHVLGSKHSLEGWKERLRPRTCFVNTILF